MKKVCLCLVFALLLGMMGCSTGPAEPTTLDRIPVDQDRIPIQNSTDPAPSDPAPQDPSSPSNPTVGNSLIIPKSLSDNCVLQQNTTVNIWGSYDGEGELTLTFNGKEYKTTAQNGKFNFRVDTPAGSLTAYEITIQSSTETKVIRNVAVGEVFLMGGQSNMTFFNIQLKDVPPEATDGGNPYIRFVNTVPYNKHVTEPVEVQGTWYVTDNNTFNGMSAFCSWFGRRMYDELQVPIGLVTCAMSDSSLAAWLTEEDAAQLDRENVAISEPYHQHTPAQLYNSVLYSYLNYTFRGVVWYQGESSTHDTYEQNLTHFIQCWRKYLNVPELPFVIVQLPGYGTYADWPTARQAQKNVANTVKNVAYSVNIDLGEQNDIHPQDKKPIAQRAADVMLNLVYGANRPIAALFDKAVKSGDTVTIHLTHAQGLKITGEATGLEILDNGAQWKAVSRDQITISGTTIQISGVSSATAVRYAWASWPTVAFFNGDDLPVEPFYAELNG